MNRRPVSKLVAGLALLGGLWLTVVVAQAPPPPTVLFVTGATPSAGDNAIVSRLQDAAHGGYVITLQAANGIADAAQAAALANGKSVVLISASASAADLGTKFRGVATPVVTWQAGNFFSMNMVGGTAPNPLAGSAVHFSEVVIGNPAHKMAANLSGVLTTTTTVQTYSWGWPVNGFVVATIGVDTNQAAIFGFEEGKPMVDATNAPKRRVGLFLAVDTATSLTSDGWALFEAAVAWARTVNTAPAIADLPTSTSIADPRDSLELAAGVSDPDGQPEPPVTPALTWSKVSGPGTVTFTAVDAPWHVKAVFSALGDYQIKLVASDGLASAEHTISVAVGSPCPGGGGGLCYDDRPPDVHITSLALQAITLPATASLTATATDEGYPNPPGALSIMWSKLNGPTSGTVSFSPPNALNMAATFSKPGLYDLQLTVTDGNPDPSHTISRNATVTVNSSALMIVHSSTVQPTLTLSTGDTAIRNRLTSLGYDVVFAREVDLDPTASVANNKALVVISGTVTPDTNIGIKLKAKAVPVVTLKSTLFDDMGMSGPTSGTHYGTTATQTQVAMVAASSSHALAAGLSGTVTVDSAAATFNWGASLAGAPIRVATLASDGNKSTIFGFPSGAAMFGANVAPANRVGFFAGDAAVQSLTSAGWQLFDAAVSWVSAVNLPPRAEAGPDQSVLWNGTSVSVPLHGVVSDDGLPAPPGQRTLEWSQQVTGPCPAGPVSFTGPNPFTTSINPASFDRTATFSAPGCYVLSLAADDGDLKTIDTMTVHVLTVNSPPQVYAGMDQTVIQTNVANPATATLTGTVSDDGLPSPPATVTQAWTFVGGPATPTITSPNSLSTSVQFPAASAQGLYLFRLTASDSQSTAFDEVAITVKSGALLVTNTTIGSPPDADPGVPADVAFKSRLLALGYDVTVTSGAAATSAMATGKAIVVIAGSVVATDVTTKFRLVTVPVLVSRSALLDDMSMVAANALGQVDTQSQVAVFTATHPVAAGLTGTLTVSNPVSSFGWGTAAVAGVKVATVAGDSAKATIFTYDTGATMAGLAAPARRVGFFALAGAAANLNASGIKLLDAAIDWATKTNLPPRVTAGPDRSVTWVSPSTPVTLNAAVSDDGRPAPPGAVTIAWSKVNDPPDGLPVPSFTNLQPDGDITATFTAPGKYTLRITVRDGVAPIGVEVTDDVLVYVNDAANPPPNQAPVVHACSNPVAQPCPAQNVDLPAPVELVGTAADDGLPAPPGTLTYAWSRVSGPGTVSFANAAAAATTATFDAAGTYVLKLTASDSVLSSTDTVTVNVSADALLVTQAATLLSDETAILNRLQGLGFNVATADVSAVVDGSIANGYSLVVISPQAPEASLTTKFKLVNVPVLTAVSSTNNQLYVDMGLTATGSGTNWGSAGGGTQVTVPNPGNALTASLTGTVTVTSSSIHCWGVVGAAGIKGPTFVSNATRATVLGYEKGAAMPGLAAGAPARRVGFGLLPTALNTTGWYLFDGAVRWMTALNAPPRVNAGADQTITLPSAATLSGSVVDDGVPTPANVTKLWTAAAGPAGVTFDSASSPSTVAHFVLPGTYILQLAASDGVYTRSDQVEITVNPAPANAAPAVNVGPDLTVRAPLSINVYGPVTLSAAVSDDGLPSPPAALTYSWTKVAGPGTPPNDVSFTPANAITTAVTFPVVGTYTLRLSVGDGVLNSQDDVMVTVQANKTALLVVSNTANPPPVGSGDAAIQARLAALGFTVTVAADNAAGLASSAGTKDLVFVSGTVSETLIGTQLQGVAKPVIVSKAAVYPNMAMSDSAAGAGIDFGETPSTSTLVALTNPQHPIALRAHLGDVTNVTVTKQGTALAWANGLATERQATSVVGFVTHATLFAYEKGETMLAAVDAPARRVGFFSSDGAHFTDDGWALFDASVGWATDRLVPVLFVRGNIPYQEGRIRGELINLGYALTVKTDATVTAADAAPDKAAVVVVSRSVTAATLGTKLQGVQVPVISFDPENFNAMGMSGLTQGDDWGYALTQRSVGIIAGQETHPLAAGLSGQQIAVLTAQNGDFGWAVPGPAATRVAVVVGFSWGATVFGYEKGAAMPGAISIAPARRVGLFINENSAGNFTNEGWSLWDAAVRWCGNADPDNDGLSTFDEFRYGTDPVNADTNGDGILDGIEVNGDKGALNTDMDGDGLTNAQELLKGTDPFNADTDGDLVLDGADCFPLDATRSTCPPPGDANPPVITLQEPTNAVLISSVP